MRALIGPLSLIYGVGVTAAFAFTIYSRWLSQPLWVITSEITLLGTVLAAFAVPATALCMAVGGVAMLLGKQWSVPLLNRSAAGVALTLFCYFSLCVLLDALRETDEPMRDALARQWGTALSAATIPLLVVWWTGRNIGVPVEQLSWTWHRNQRRGRRMSGRCHHCGAPLNFATGEGVRVPRDDAFSLFCTECNAELTLTDVA